MRRRAVFWLAFIALVAVFIYGFWSAGLVRETPWSQLGLRRVLWFAAAYAAWMLIGRLLFPRRLALVTVLVALVYAVVAAGPLACIAVIFLFMSAWAVGALLRIGGLLGVLVGLSVLAFVVGFAVLTPVNYGPVYAVALAAPVLLAWRRIRTQAQEFRRNWELSAPSPYFLAFPLLLHLVVAIGPEVSTDGLAMHLAIPASVAAHHQWIFDVRQTAWAVMPMNADWCFTAAYLLGGEMAARLFNFGMLLVICAGLYGLVRSPLLVAVFTASPIVQLLTGSLFVENFWAALILGAFIALVRYHECRHARYALTSAVLLGSGLATKVGTFAFLIPFAILLVIELRRLAPAMLLVILAVGSPPYLNAYFRTGNPVFPFLNNVFKSPYFEPIALIDERFRRPLSVTTLYDLTFHTSQYLEAQNGGWAFQYLLFLPLAILLIRRSYGYAGIAALVTSLAYSVITLSTQSNVRYLYPALPLFTIGAAAMMASFKDQGTVCYRALLAASAALFLVNLCFLPASGWDHKDLFTSPTRRRELIDYLNRKYPSQPVAFIETNQIAGLLGPAYTTTWHNEAFYRRLQSAISALDCLRVMDEFHVRYFIAPTDLARVSQSPLRVFLRALAVREAESDGWQVMRLRDNYASTNLLEEGRSPVGTGSYDDTDPRIGFIGAWLSDRQFSSAMEGTIAYSNRPGSLFRVTFDGTRLTWIYTKAPNRGLAQVTIDGSPRTTVDLYSPRLEWQSRTAFSDLSAGRHVLEVRVSGMKNSASEDCYVDVDSIVIE